MTKDQLPYAIDQTLFAALLAAASRHGSDKPILEDAERQPLTYRRLIQSSFVLGARLAAGTRRSENVGILLPNVCALPVTLFGLNAFGRVAAILNFTAGPKNLSSAVRTAIVGTVISSRRFVEQAKLEDVIEAIEAVEVSPGRRVRVIYLEDARKQIGPLDKLVGFLRSLVPGLVHRSYALAPDRPAVILFTSGTEGAPKGVVLSSRNLVANSAQVIAHAADVLSPADTMMNPLPLFHSFGLTAGTLMPLLNGIKVVLYPSPLHYRQVPKLVQATGATVLVSTDTFLQGYARAAEPGDLASVRFVVAGAERVKEQTRDMWAKTGTQILEGYGATELSPVLACNLPDGNHPGTVGRLLPAIKYRLEPVEGIAEGGRLFVRGPNVMLGYMLADAPGVIVAPSDGWHDTGDIVTVDAEGFVTIRGRAKRFAKIGGEMISLASVESMVSALWPQASHVVVGIPDARKGEQLVLVTDKADADKDVLLRYAREQGYPELWVPRAMLVVPGIPVLGSGKVDLPTTLEMVRQSRPLL
jgi:acyl-[acyl-carrier-protein]-phospholipid O-acyltransferase/long-chain-fatty-acid--[acyl-carrier-protein] ligase